jgi:predicted nucleic acid binding AN1-type Zn finger protein
MELPHLGTKCDRIDCIVKNDYLPFQCIFCQQKFCEQHQRAIEIVGNGGHLCPKYPKDKRAIVCPLCEQIVSIPPSKDPNDIVNEHISKGCPKTQEQIYKNQCSFSGCGKRELIPILCKQCEKSFCIKHRLEQDHKCVPVTKSLLSSVPKLMKSKKECIIQ